MPLVYDELRRLAAAKLNQEKPGQTLQATALVHEAYLRLVGSGSAQVSDHPRTATAGDGLRAVRTARNLALPYFGPVSDHPAVICCATSPQSGNLNHS